MRWYIVHTIFPLTQITLFGASFASFAQEGYNSTKDFHGGHDDAGNVIRPWVSCFVSSMGAFISIGIIAKTYALEISSTFSTEEQRRLLRRYTLSLSALATLIIAAADVALAISFSSERDQPVATIAVRFLTRVTAIVALAAFVEDIVKLRRDRSDSRDVEIMDQEQYLDDPTIETLPTVNENIALSPI